MTRLIIYSILFLFPAVASSQYSEDFLSLIRSDKITEESRTYAKWVDTYPDEALYEVYGDWIYEIYSDNQDSLREKDIICLLTAAVEFYLHSKTKTVNALHTYGLLISLHSLNHNHQKSKYLGEKVKQLIEDFNLNNKLESWLSDVITHSARVNNNALSGNDYGLSNDHNSLFDYKVRIQNGEDLTTEIKSILRSHDSLELTQEGTDTYHQWLGLWSISELKRMEAYLNNNDLDSVSVYELESIVSTNTKHQAFFLSYFENIDELELRLTELSNSLYSDEYLHLQIMLGQLAVAKLWKSSEIIRTLTRLEEVVLRELAEDTSEQLFSKLGLFALQLEASIMLEDSTILNSQHLEDVFKYIEKQINSDAEINCSELYPFAPVFHKLLPLNDFFTSVDVCMFNNMIRNLLSICPEQKSNLNHRDSTLSILDDLCGSPTNENALLIRRLNQDNYVFSFSNKDYLLEIDEVSTLRDFFSDPHKVQNIIPHSIKTRLLEKTIWNIVPSGIFNVIDLRFIPHEGKYLFNKINVEYTIDEPTKTQKSEASKNYIGFGNITYSTNSSKGFGALDFRNDTWSNLPNTKQEIDQVSQYFDKPITFEEQAATESNFYANSDARVIHFAAHGSTGGKEEAFIVLLPDEINDGKLTESEIANLDLTATELVILSTCNSGYIETLEEDYTSTLAGAFLKAGVKNVIFSKDKVADFYAKEFINRFVKYYSLNPNTNLAFNRCIKEMHWEYPNELSKWSIFNYIRNSNK